MIAVLVLLAAMGCLALSIYKVKRMVPEEYLDRRSGCLRTGKSEFENDGTGETAGASSQA